MRVRINPAKRSVLFFGLPRRARSNKFFFCDSLKSQRLDSLVAGQLEYQPCKRQLHTAVVRLSRN